MVRSGADKEFAELITKVEAQDCPRKSYSLVHDRIARLRRSGRDVPRELVAMERRLASECAAHSQGR